MKYLVIILLFISSLWGEKILLINSNSDIKKYRLTQKEFLENFDKEVISINIKNWSNKETKDYLFDEYPDIVYTIGSKAYQYTNRYIPEKKIFFSSIVNWQKLEMSENRFGVSNELHSGMKVALIKSIFPKLESISIIYSKHTKGIYENIKKSANEYDIRVIAKEIKDENTKLENISNTILDGEAFLLLPDLTLLSNEQLVKNIFTFAKRNKKPIFAYDELFIRFGATMILSIDNPTVGRQVATMLKKMLNKEKFKKIQYPVGSNIIFNQTLAKEYNLSYDEQMLSIFNKVIK